MFKRRKPLSLSETAQQIFWPSMGWKRSILYTKHRLLRVSDTTHSIALGLAIGLGVSFTPLLGTHFLQAGIIAFLLRGNVFTAMIGTWIGNPWTFPFFWWAGLSFGSFLFSFFGIQGASDIPDALTLSTIWDLAWTEPLTLFFPWMLGGYILLVLSIPPSYLLYYKMIHSAKKAREVAREKARALKLKKPKSKSLKAPKE